MLEDYRINGIAKIASAETGFITAVDTLRPDATVVKGAFVASCFDDALNTTSCALFRIRICIFDKVSLQYLLRHWDAKCCT